MLYLCCRLQPERLDKQPQYPLIGSTSHLISGRGLTNFFGHQLTNAMSQCSGRRWWRPHSLSTDELLFIRWYVRQSTPSLQENVWIDTISSGDRPQAINNNIRLSLLRPLSKDRPYLLKVITKPLARSYNWWIER